MTRAELQILLWRYLSDARPGDYVIVDCGPCFVQSARQDDTMLVEARGELGPELLRRIEDLFAGYRLGGRGASEVEAGWVGLVFSSGDSNVADAMSRALDLIAFATGQPLRLSDGEGAFMPKRTGFLGLGGYGPIA